MKVRQILRFLPIPLFLVLAPLSIHHATAATLNPPPDQLFPPGASFTCRTNGTGTACESIYPFSNGFVDTTLCSFTIQGSFAGSLRDILFYDTSGTLVRETIQPLGAIGTITSPYRTVTVHPAGRTLITYNADGTLTITSAGTLNGGVSTIPGFGVVNAAAGRTVGVFDPATNTFTPISQHGNFIVASAPQNAATTCAAYGPH